MHSALSVKWTTPIPGREQLALDYSVELNQYFDQLAADGKCTQLETFVFSGGSLWMVKGQYDALSEVYFSDGGQQVTPRESPCSRTSASSSPKPVAAPSSTPRSTWPNSITPGSPGLGGTPRCESRRSNVGHHREQGLTSGLGPPENGTISSRDSGVFDVAHKGLGLR